MICVDSRYLGNNSYHTVCALVVMQCLDLRMLSFYQFRLKATKKYNNIDLKSKIKKIVCTFNGSVINYTKRSVLFNTCQYFAKFLKTVSKMCQYFSKFLNNVKDCQYFSKFISTVSKNFRICLSLSKMSAHCQ